MPPQKLRILFLGASIVAGYSSLGAVYHPFSINVVKMLSMISPDTKIETVVDGVPGDLVSRGKFLERMQEHFEEGNEPFDWTIVLGATNDIAMAIDTEEIFERFKKVWDIPLKHGSKVLAITVPRATSDPENPELVERRSAINKKIMDYTKDGFHTFDLHHAMPCDSAHRNLKYWDDAIHFTPDGYNFIGDRVGVALTGLIVAENSGQH